MPPPAEKLLTELSRMVESATSSVPVLKMPPPRLPPPAGIPSAMLSPERTTWNGAAMLKTREVWLPLTVITLAPGPVMVRSLAIISSPLVSMMVPFKPA
jgi:hypothetical protein